MPLFALICTDRPGTAELRLATRPAHRAYLEASGVIHAGPFLHDGVMTGSLVVIDTETRDQAQAWAGADPYARAGLFADVRIEEWQKVIG